MLTKNITLIDGPNGTASIDGNVIQGVKSITASVDYQGGGAITIVTLEIMCETVNLDLDRSRYFGEK